MSKEEKTEDLATDKKDAKAKAKETKSKNPLKRRKANKTKEELENTKVELAEAKDKYLRLFAEFDNYKKRSIKEKLETMKNAAQDTIQALLPILDDFDRAKKSADDENSTEQFSEGVQLVYNKIHGVLGNKGLKEMESTGLAFDPELHEAITKISAPNEDMKGKVIDTIEKGYFLNDKIIRHAKVVVGE